jgi:hypothetical protein
MAAGIPIASEAAVVDESPFAPREILTAESLGAPPAHRYGAASMQSYANGQVAYHTHASADGFLAYVNQFEQTSFRVKDAQVAWWEYSPTFDDWQDNYGCDSVDVYYHAGHGGTDAGSGHYGAPLGSVWDNRDSLDSSEMSIGDQRLRYLFLATCEGCMVFPPNNPIRTWHPPNRGIRMLFGGTANIYDDPNYGTNFWNHWRSGDSFSQAWQDALLDAGSSQQPSSTACGSSANDASTRLFNERMFYWDSVERAWYWWRWVGNAPAGPGGLTFEVPRQLSFPELAPRASRRRHILEALKSHGIEPGELTGALEGTRITSETRTRAAVLHGGGIVIEHHPAVPQRSELSEVQVVEAASSVVAGLGPLRLVHVAPAWHAGGTPTGDGTLIDAEIFEHVVTYRQEIAGLHVVTPGSGEVRLHIRHDGEVRRIVDTRLDVAEVRDHGPEPIVTPTPDGKELRAHRLSSRSEVLNAVERAASEPSRNESTEAEKSLHVEVGYSVRGTTLVPVARATVEFGNQQYRMLRAIEVSLIA